MRIGDQVDIWLSPSSSHRTPVAGLKRSTLKNVQFIVRDLWIANAYYIMGEFDRIIALAVVRNIYIQTKRSVRGNRIRGLLPAIAAGLKSVILEERYGRPF
ncbi:MAG: hypothetical protein DMG06_27650 [Acidobacteria bacterium]|nr:MAG: hypothetical protein DMG06_27650 [Acidobacteriota bacterium]